MRPLPLVVLLASVGCGYGFRAERRAIHLAAVEEEGLDRDAAALLSTALRRGLARGPSTSLADRTGADLELHVALLAAGAALEPFADPGLRAAQYKASVRLEARLFDRGGRLVWVSPPITGEAPFLGVPGPLETLDGARRRALSRAADDAAERLLASLAWRDAD